MVRNMELCLEAERLESFLVRSSGVQAGFRVQGLRSLGLWECCEFGGFSVYLVRALVFKVWGSGQG